MPAIELILRSVALRFCEPEQPGTQCNLPDAHVGVLEDEQRAELFAWTREGVLSSVSIGSDSSQQSQQFSTDIEAALLGPRTGGSGSTRW